MDETLLRFLESIARSRCFLRQRGIHPDFDADFALLEAARVAGLAEGRVETLSGGTVDFFHAWLTEEGKRHVVATSQGDALRA